MSRSITTLVSQIGQGLALGLLLSTVGCGGGDGSASPDAGTDASDATPDTSTEDTAAVDTAKDDTAPDTAPYDPCDGCHGTRDIRAPAIGAHVAHLEESDWHGEVRCRHCHNVPEDESTAGHTDDRGADDVILSGISTSGMIASYNADGTCSTYCHGGALLIEQITSTPWDDTVDLECGDCHTMPPAAPHPAGETCGRCHMDLIDDNNVITTAYFHIDSIVQAPHNAHIAHLGGRGVEESGDLECTECHDGTNYHGPLKDGNSIDTTTICNTEGCHATDRGTVETDEWFAHGGLIDLL